MKKLLFIFLISIATAPLFAAYNPDGVLGVWQDGNGKGHIQIYKQNGKYYGKIIWMKNPNDAGGKPKLDVKNPNASLRSKPLLGSIILKGFSYDSDDNEWDKGHIYNPNDGKDYKAYMKLKDKNTLIIHGYVGFTWIGRSETWTRVR